MENFLGRAALTLAASLAVCNAALYAPPAGIANANTANRLANEGRLMKFVVRPAPPPPAKSILASFVWPVRLALGDFLSVG